MKRNRMRVWRERFEPLSVDWILIRKVRLLLIEVDCHGNRDAAPATAEHVDLLASVTDADANERYSTARSAAKRISVYHEVSVGLTDLGFTGTAPSYAETAAPASYLNEARKRRASVRRRGRNQS